MLQYNDYILHVLQSVGYKVNLFTFRPNRQNELRIDLTEWTNPYVVSAFVIHITVGFSILENVGKFYFFHNHLCHLHSASNLYEISVVLSFAVHNVYYSQKALVSLYSFLLKYCQKHLNFYRRLNFLVKFQTMLKWVDKLY